MKVFFCYSRVDENVVLGVAENLRRAGHEPWVDKHELNAPTAFTLEIQYQIDRSDVFLFFASPGSTRPDGYCITEVTWALRREVDHGVPVVWWVALPGLATQSMPPGLAVRQGITIEGDPVASITLQLRALLKHLWWARVRAAGLRGMGAAMIVAVVVGLSAKAYELVRQGTESVSPPGTAPEVDPDGATPPARDGAQTPPSPVNWSSGVTLTAHPTHRTTRWLHLDLEAGPEAVELRDWAAAWTLETCPYGRASGPPATIPLDFAWSAKAVANDTPLTWSATQEAKPSLRSSIKLEPRALTHLMLIVPEAAAEALPRVQVSATAVRSTGETERIHVNEAVLLGVCSSAPTGEPKRPASGTPLGGESGSKQAAPVPCPMSDLVVTSRANYSEGGGNHTLTLRVVGGVPTDLTVRVHHNYRHTIGSDVQALGAGDFPGGIATPGNTFHHGERPHGTVSWTACSSDRYTGPIGSTLDFEANPP